MMEIELWDGTKARPRPIARLEVNEDNELKVISGEGKVRVDKVSIGGEFRSVSKERYLVYTTNLSMPTDLDSASVF